jgi:hypothetical protein
MGLKNTAVLAVIWVLALAGAQRVFSATTTITAVTGGSAISATNAVSAWTTLTGPVLTESSSGAIGTGTIILTAPSGFAFNTSATVTVKVNGGSTASRNINHLANNSTMPVTVAASTLTVTITAASTGTFNANTLTWQNIQVRPTAGTPLASGALTESGTCTFQGLTGSWGTLTEVVGPVARLAFTTQPVGATAGAALVTQPVVSTRDQFGNSSTNGLPANSFVAVTLTGGTGPLQGTTSLNLGLSGGKGTAAFTDLRIDAAGSNKQLTVTSTNGLTSDVSSVFAISPAVASKLAISTQPAATAVAGVPFAQQPVVLIQDAFNNLRSSDTLVVTATRNAGAGALLGATNITAVGGVATFTSLAHPYATNITLAFTSGSLTATNSSPIAVSSGPFSQLQLLLPGETAAPTTPTGKTGTPAAQTAGTAFSGRVNAADAYWNTANTNVAVVGLTCSDTTAALPASVALVNGTNSFNVTMKAAATQTVRATYSTMNTTSAPVVVAAGAAVKLLALMPGETAAPGTPNGKTGTPAAQTAGTPFTVTVNAVDTNWNLVVSTHTIAITCSDTNAALPSSAALSGGTGPFSVTFKTAGSWTVTATDTSAGPLSSNTSTLTPANPGLFGKLQVLLPGETAVPGSAAGKTGAPGAQTAGLAFSGRVNAVDAYWNIVSTNVAAVALTNSDVTGVIPASVALVNGTNSFSVTMNAAGSRTVAATYLAINGTSAPVVINAGTAAKLLVLMPGETPAPGTLTGKTGTPFTVTVNAVDTNWNVATSTHTIAITASDTNAVLPSNAALSGGTGSFSVTFKTAGSWSVTATDTSAGPLSSNTGSLTTANPGLFSKLQVLLPGETAVPGSAAGKTGAPSTQTAGVAFNGRVNAVDACWNIANTNVAAVALTNSDVTGVIPASVALVNGTNSFSVTMKAAGSQTVTATYLAINATSAPVVVNGGVAAKLLVLMPGETAAPGTPNGKTGTPTAQTAGTPFTVTVNAVDTNWNLAVSTHTIAIIASDTNAVLPGSSALVGGAGSFSVTFKTAGSWNVTATDTSGSPLSANSGSLTTVNPGAFAMLQVLLPGETAAPVTPTGKIGTPSAQTAGTAFSGKVNAVDVYWNIANTNVAVVGLTNSDPTAVLPASVALVNGTNSFNVTMKAVGSQTVTATYLTMNATSAPVQVTAGSALKLLVLMPGETAAPGTVSGKAGTPLVQTAGTPFSVTVNAVDTNWNPAVSTHTIAITSTDTNAVMPGSAALSGGTGTFSVTFKTAGNWAATATDTTASPLSPNTGSLTAVSPGAFAKLQVLLPGESAVPGSAAGKTGTPSAQTAGVAFGGRINAVDGYWNVATTTNPVVSLACSDATAVLPASVVLVNGTNTAGVTMNLAGSQTVTATYLTMNTTSAPVAINAGTAAKLLVLMPGETPALGTPTGRAGTPTAQTAGTPFTVTVNAVDTNWNLAASTHTIAITASDTNAVLPSNAALSGGTGSFSVTFKTAGSWSVTATDTSAGPLSSNTGSPTTATPGAFAKLQVLMPGETGAPGTATGRAGVAAGQTAGIPFAVVVSAVDANWNSISTNDTVHLTSSDTNAALPADTSLVSGTKALSVTLNTAGTRTVTVSDVTQGGITANTSTAISVSPGPFAKLQLLMPGEAAAAGTTTGKTGSPSAQTVGTAFNLTVNAVDAQWNILNTNHTVAITSSDSNATLPTNAALVNGTKTFSLTFKTAGSQTATATDVTDGTKSPTTSPLTQVNAGAFAKLQLLVPGETSAPGTTTGKSGAPFNQISNIAFTVTVSGVDANWNVVNTNDTMRFTSSDNRAVLPTNAPLVAGTRNFSVTLMTVGASTLTVSNVTHTGITANTSSAITVVAQGYVTNSLNFTNATRQALLADGWSFIATLPGGGPRNTEITNSADGALVSYDQVAHPGVLRIPTDTGDLWGTANSTRNSLFHNLSSNWVSLRLDVSFAPTNNFQQAQLALYQDDDNYIEIGHAYSSDLGGEMATLAWEDGGVQTSWSPLSLSQAKVSASRMQLRLDRDLVTDKVSALYSLDGTNWAALGQTCQALTNAQVCLWTGGSMGGLPNCDLRRLDIITSSTPLNPILVAQPQHLVFNAVAGQACTNLQQLRVVARRAPVSQAFTITNNASWLSASTATGNTPGSCDVSVNTTGLAAGTYQGLLTCSAPGATSAVASVTLIVNPAVRARVASWRGAKAGAMTVWVDDSRPTAFDELTADGFQGSYLLWGVTPIPVWATNYYLAGMELGGHTVDHLCLALDEPATRYELETNIASICAASPQPSSNLITFAFPCGFAPVASQVIASDYYLTVHGYNINQLEDASPYNFMNLKTFNSHEHTPYPPADFKPLVDAANRAGQMVQHGTPHDQQLRRGHNSGGGQGHLGRSGRRSDKVYSPTGPHRHHQLPGGCRPNQLQLLSVAVGCLQRAQLRDGNWAAGRFDLPSGHHRHQRGLQRNPERQSNTLHGENDGWPNAHGLRHPCHHGSANRGLAVSAEPRALPARANQPGCPSACHSHRNQHRR